MAFFKPTPNVPDAEKAKVEFHFQQIAECLGIERFKLPVLSMTSLLESTRNQSAEQLIGFVGDHLGHNTSGLNVVVVPEKLEKCGGGG